MKIKITESQYKSLIEDMESPVEIFNKYKEICFKYWDRFGPGINESMVRVLNIHKFVKRHEYFNILCEWLREFIGVEESINKTYEFLKHDGHHIQDGGYDFTFEVPDIEFVGEIGKLTILVNDIDGIVTLIMTDNSEHTLSDALNDDEIGWEIKYEVNDTITDYITENVEKKFGVICHVDEIKYESKL